MADFWKKALPAVGKIYIDKKARLDRRVRKLALQFFLLLRAHFQTLEFTGVSHPIRKLHLGNIRRYSGIRIFASDGFMQISRTESILAITTQY